MSLDVTDEESMAACVNHIIEKEGHIDILLNNAGYGSCGSIEDIPMSEVKHQYEVNVFGLGRMIQLVLPWMRKNGYGRIINISSMGGRFTTPFGGWYHSTKYAVESIIAAQNIRNYSGSGAYRDNADRSACYYEKRYGEGSHVLTDPKSIARTVGKAATVRKPKLRYLVGKNSKSFVFLKFFLSDRMFQKVTVSSMGFK